MNYIKKAFGFYVKTSLVVRILVGLAIGVLLGLVASEATFIKVFGDLFVGALKAIAPIL